MSYESITFDEKRLYECIELEMERYSLTLDIFNILTEDVLNKYALFTEEAIARGFIEYILRLKNQEGYL